MPDYELERAAKAQGYTLVAGIDEAGRGPWAGPVVAGAAILDVTRIPEDLLAALDDSKKLSAKKRDTLFTRLTGCEAVVMAVGKASVEEIDTMNILAATMLAMRRAVESLENAPDLALIDGNRTPDLPCPARAVVKGDGKSLSIAAASIVAKVTRDRIMAELAERNPGYGWERNAGYGTKDHQEGLRIHGVTVHHRRSFAPIAHLVAGDSDPDVESA